MSDSVAARRSERESRSAARPAAPLWRGRRAHHGERPPVIFYPRKPSSRCPEIDCVRHLVPGRTAGWAEQRAVDTDVGADRVLIAHGQISEEAYAVALAAALGVELQELIRRMSAENPLWGSARIRGELLKPGFRVNQTTVWKYMPKRPRNPSGSRRVFLRNHMRTTAAVDMFVVVSLTFRLLYAVAFLSHDRRKVIHFDVTANPTSDWLTLQAARAFPNDKKHKILLRDRDRAFGESFQEQVEQLGIEEVLAPPYSPWDNPYVERVVRSIRNDCLDHHIVINERHLRSILTSYFRYYNQSRTHLSLGLGPN